MIQVAPVIVCKRGWGCITVCNTIQLQTGLLNQRKPKQKTASSVNQQLNNSREISPISFPLVGAREGLWAVPLPCLYPAITATSILARFDKILSGGSCLGEEAKLVLCGTLLLMGVLACLFEENGTVTPTISLFVHQVSSLVGLPQAKVQPVSAGLLGLSFLFFFILFCFKHSLQDPVQQLFRHRVWVRDQSVLDRILIRLRQILWKEGTALHLTSISVCFTCFCGLQEVLRSELGTKFSSCVLQCSSSEVTATR